MQAWMEGYESDIEYTAGYFREQEPDFLNLCAITHGVSPISLEKEFVYCELGCGQGMTSLIMASNYPMGKFYAIDFNPSQIARARQLAEQAGLNNVVFLENSFAEIAEDPTILPQCDFIVFHGIFTWVSDENRQYLFDICKKNLKSGGLVYNSYNAKPGWSMGEPIHELMLASGKLFAGASPSRFKQARALLEELNEAKPAFFGINQELIEKRLAILSSNDLNYLVHEYFNDGWKAFYFTEVARYLNSAKLEYIGEASVAAAYTNGLLPPKARQLLSKIPDQSVRELYKDVLLNTTFRKDIYRRGISDRLDARRQFEALRGIRWMLGKIPGSQSISEFKFKLQIGEVSGKPETYQPIMDCLSDQPATLEVLQEKTGIVLKDLVQAMMFLFHSGLVGIKYEDEPTPAALRLNRLLASRVFITRGESSHVVLPYRRSVISLKMMDMLFYHAALATETQDSSEALVEYAARELEIRDLKVNHAGQELTGQPMRDRLYELENLWRKNVLPILQRGGALV